MTVRRTRFTPPANKATVGRFPINIYQRINPQETPNRAYMKRQPRNGGSN